MDLTLGRAPSPPRPAPAAGESWQGGGDGRCARPSFQSSCGRENHRVLPPSFQRCPVLRAISQAFSAERECRGKGETVSTTVFPLGQICSMTCAVCAGERESLCLCKGIRRGKSHRDTLCRVVSCLRKRPCRRWKRLLSRMFPPPCPRGAPSQIAFPHQEPWGNGRPGDIMLLSSPYRACVCLQGYLIKCPRLPGWKRKEQSQTAVLSTVLSPPGSPYRPQHFNLSSWLGNPELPRFCAPLPPAPHSVRGERIF